MEKVENIKRPLIKGEILLVPCVVRKITSMSHTRCLDNGRKKRAIVHEITPILNCFHSDEENGQQEKHYHTDYRFVRCSRMTSGDMEILRAEDRHSEQNFSPESRVFLHNGGKIEYIALPVIDPNAFYGITPVSMISKSKLKHSCIHKGKCPHRGFDLSQVAPDENGVITCPLHGLKFDSKTKKIMK